MSRKQKPTLDEEMTRATVLLVTIFVVTIVGTIGSSLLFARGISTWIWISVGLLSLIYFGAWWYYKVQIDAERREESEARQTRIEAQQARQDSKKRKSQRRD